MKHKLMFANCSEGDFVSVRISAGGGFDGVYGAEILAVRENRSEILVWAGGRNFWLCENSNAVLCCPGGEKVGICGSWEFENPTP